MVKDAKNIIKKMITKPENQSSVLSIRKQMSSRGMQGPPSMSSVYQGQASFLDYKKRTKPIQTKDIVRQLEEIPMGAKSRCSTALSVSARRHYANNIFLTEAVASGDGFV